MAPTLLTFEEKKAILNEKPQKGMCIQVTQSVPFSRVASWNQVLLRLRKCPSEWDDELDYLLGFPVQVAERARPMGITAGLHSGIYKVLHNVPSEELGPACSRGNALSQRVRPTGRGSGFFLQELFKNSQHFWPWEMPLKRTNILLPPQTKLQNHTEQVR